MHTPLAMWLIDVLRPATFVELGSYSGTSYCAFCQAVQELKLPTKCYAVDTWKGDVHASMYGEDVFQELSTYHDANYASFSRLVREDFDGARAHFTDGSIDLLHIDGLHTYEAVKHDFESWRPKLSDRGVVLFHDTNVHERDFGVAQLWEELKREYLSLEVLHGHGLGILLVGKSVPAELREIAERVRSSSDDLRKFQDFFAYLGRAAFLELKEANSQAEQARHEARVTELELHREALLQKVARLERAYQEERAQPKGMLAPLRIMKRAVVGPRSK